MVTGAGRREPDVVGGALKVQLVEKPNVMSTLGIGRRRPDVVGGAMKVFLSGSGPGGGASVDERIAFSRAMGIWVVLDQSDGPVIAPANTNLNVLISPLVPSGSMGDNGKVRLKIYANFTVGNVGVLRHMWGANLVSGTNISNTNRYYRSGGEGFIVSNQDDAAVQCTESQSTNFGANNAVPNALTAIDTDSNDVAFSVDLQLSTVVGTFVIHRWTLELLAA